MWIKDCYFQISGHKVSLSSDGSFQGLLQRIILTSFCPNPTNTKEGILYAQNIRRAMIQFYRIEHGNLKKQTLLHSLQFLAGEDLWY